MNLLDECRRALDALDPGYTWRHVVVGVSGGPDSVALLDLLVTLGTERGFAITVAHADHGIHPDARAVAEQVLALAARYGCPCRCGQLALGAEAGETRAREARLRWLAAVGEAEAADVVALAHHADDQAETVLLRVLHGSGPAGLAAMAPRRGRFIRPLLAVPGAVIRAYCRERGIPHWDDPANADPRHLRSWLRRRVLPALRRRLPSVDQRLLRTARLAGEDRQAWNLVLDRLPGLEPRAEPDGISVVAGVLVAYDSLLARSVLLGLARRADCPLGPVRAARLLAWLPRAGAGRRVELGRGWQAAVAQGRLHLVRGGEPPPPVELAGPAGHLQWGSWQVSWRPDRAPPARRAGGVAWVVSGPLLLRPPRPGDQARPLGGPGRKPVVRCLQEAGVPAFRRSHWPVLVCHDEVVWVAGVCRCDAALPPEGREATRIDVHRHR